MYDLMHAIALLALTHIDRPSTKTFDREVIGATYGAIGKLWFSGVVAMAIEGCNVEPVLISECVCPSCTLPYTYAAEYFVPTDTQCGGCDMDAESISILSDYARHERNLCVQYEDDYPCDGGYC